MNVAAPRAAARPGRRRSAPTAPAGVPVASTGQAEATIFLVLRHMRAPADRPHHDLRGPSVLEQRSSPARPACR
ncbi:hypothetical protein HBB16_17665 [Pseudonocardia sp. MCCB 268]|nr:hypothetical protein [Pseudonocardia cytotoxica]